MDRPNILILEDDFILAQDYRAQLEKVGYIVYIANHSTDALQECTRRVFDAVVADVFILDSGVNIGKGGADFLIKIRNSGPGQYQTPKDVPVLVVSGAPSAKLSPGGIFAAAKALGANEALSRPFEINDLVAKVGEMIGQPIPEKP